MLYFSSIFLGCSLSLLLNLDNNFITKKIGSNLLQTGIVLLGFTISYESFVALDNRLFPLIILFSIIVFFSGLLIGKALKIEKNISYLVSVAAAICGGTAVAAIAPIIKSKASDIISIISILFFLNIISIIFFPSFGIYLGLDNIQFGILSALAIHDTSSVIATAFIFSDESAQTAAILKSFRTILLVPLIIFTSWLYSSKGKLKLPIFILFFIIAIIINNFLNLNDTLENYIEEFSQLFIIIGLFCIGTQINRDSFKEIKFMALFHFFILWILIIPISVFLINNFIG